MIEALLKAILAMTRVGIITQARTTSTRLPGKVLLEAGGASLLDHHLDRLAAAGLPVFVATTTNADRRPDRRRGATPGRRGTTAAARTTCSAGSPVRAANRARHRRPGHLGLPADRRRRRAPRASSAFVAAGDPRLYVSNAIERTYPRGLDFEVFSATRSARGRRAGDQPAEREHVTPYLYANPASRTTLHAVRHDDDASNYRVTLDTSDDLELIRRLIEQHDAAHLNVDEIVGVLEQHPELARLNAHVEQKKLGA